MDKHDLVKRLQLPYRDLREIDPEVRPSGSRAAEAAESGLMPSPCHLLLTAIRIRWRCKLQAWLCQGRSWLLQVPIPYPSGISIRDRALVVKLESIAMIITRAEVC